MIKLLYVFDKTVGMFLSGKTGREYVRELIFEEIGSADIYQAACPICGSHETSWVFRRTRKQSIVWDNPDKPIETILPQYVYRCYQCNAEGAELITTDLTIDKTNLSYHYLFHLILTKTAADSRRNRLDIYRLDNLLYGLLSEESLKKWTHRFRVDYQTLSSLQNINQDDLLHERVKMGSAFIQFYQTADRFFLSDMRPSMLLYIDKQGQPQCVRRASNSAEREM